MNSRISLILRTKNISPSQLADDLGVQRSGISHILNGRNKPSLDFIQRLIKRYPDISMTWLMFGEGPMMNPYPSKEDFKPDDKKGTNYQSTIIDLFPPLVDQAENNPTPDELTIDEMKGNASENQDVKVTSLTNEKSVQKNNDLADRNTKDSISSVKSEKQIHSNPFTPISEKKVTRIVIFYSDKSFEEFFPQED